MWKWSLEGDLRGTWWNWKIKKSGRIHGHTTVQLLPPLSTHTEWHTAQWTHYGIRLVGTSCPLMTDSTMQHYLNTSDGEGGGGLYSYILGYYLTIFCIVLTISQYYFGASCLYLHQNTSIFPSISCSPFYFWIHNFYFHDWSKFVPHGSLSCPSAADIWWAICSEHRLTIKITVSNRNTYRIGTSCLNREVPGNSQPYWT